jgi:acyl-CoA reductase-like NAD-dependent aldehyde dehydrogenase
MTAARIEVLKTYKLFINGQFPRAESGRVMSVRDSKGKLIANAGKASRKDLREAVSAARTAFSGWMNKSGYNRGQILYRLAEMIATKKLQLAEELISQGFQRTKALQNIEAAIDVLVYYSGWCDKYNQVVSTINPVAGVHNFSSAEPQGVVGIVAPKEGLLGMVAVLAPVIAGGNTAVLVCEYFPLTAITFAECIATSDMSAGVVNILTGELKELHPHIASHQEIQAVLFTGGDAATKKSMMSAASANVKRFNDWSRVRYLSPKLYHLTAFQEIKTTWHSVESGITSGQKY